MRLLVPFMMVALALAGCSGADESKDDIPTSAECLEQGLILDTSVDPPVCSEAPFVMREFEDPQHHCVVTKQRDRVHAPDLVGNPWQLGQSWDFSLNVDGEDLGITKLIYYDDQDFDGNGVPLHYMVGTPTREEALHHAIFGENPMIGRVHRVLYSPHESGDHADMFHFPLCDGSTWDTVFYGETFTLTARSADVDVPGTGPTAGFVIEGTSAEGSSLSLSYSPTAQWFTFIDLDRSDGGTVDMELEQVGFGYSGDAFFLRGQNDEFVFVGAESPLGQVAPAAASQVVSREDGGDGAYDSIGMHIVYGQTGVGASQFSITAPDGTEVYAADFTPQSSPTFVEAMIEVPYQAGDWTIALDGVTADATAAQVFAHVSMVSIYDRSGSV